MRRWVSYHACEGTVWFRLATSGPVRTKALCWGGFGSRAWGSRVPVRHVQMRALTNTAACARCALVHIAERWCFLVPRVSLEAGGGCLWRVCGLANANRRLPLFVCDRACFQVCRRDAVCRNNHTRITAPHYRWGISPLYALCGILVPNTRRRFILVDFSFAALPAPARPALSAALQVA